MMGNRFGTTWVPPWHDLWHGLDPTQTPVNIALAQRHDLYPLEATPSGGETVTGTV